MFGYIRPQKSELLVREYEQYRGVYCSLCRELGKQYGKLSRMILTYDCTFFAMLLLALTEECPAFEKKKCVVNPLKACVFCKNGGEAMDLAAALSVIMAYQKVRDNIADSRLLRRIPAYSALPYVSGARKKAAKKYPQLDEIVSVAMLEQAAVEQTPQKSIDFYAEPSAKMLENVFSLAVGAPELTPKDRVARQVGYFLGRWVYIMDAADDVEKDWQEKAFNPFLIKAGLIGTQILEKELAGKIRQDANQMLNATLSQLLAALNMLDLIHFNTILHNIIEQGLPQMQRTVLFEKEQKNGGSL